MPDSASSERTQSGAATTEENKKNRQIVIVGPIIILAILALFWLPQFFNDTAATVNNEKISLKELDKRVALEKLWSAWAGMPVSGSADGNQFRFKVLDQIVENSLVLQEARKSGVAASPQEVADQAAQVKSQLKMTDDQINSDLAGAGISRQTFDDVVREDATISRFLSTVVAKGVPQAEQQAAIENWYNNALATAKIDKRIESGGAKVGQPAPSFTLTDLSGKQVSLSDFKGKPVLINFFATWCTPCRQEMPDLQALYDAQKAGGLVVLGVNLTNQDSAKDVAQYVKDLKLTFPTVLDTTGSVASSYRVGPIPSSYFIDKDGRLRSVQVGSMSRQTMEQRLAKLN